MMKKTLIVLLFLGFTFSQNVVSFNQIVERDGLIYRTLTYSGTVNIDNLVPYSGRVYVKREKIRINQIEMLNPETPEVLKKLFFVHLSLKGSTLEDEVITSFISREFSVRKGILDGEFIEWNQFGIKTIEKNYKNGKLSGSYIKRDNYGKIIEEGTYDSNILEGFWISYETDEFGYSTEKLKSKGNYKNGMREGKWEIGSRGFIQYYSNGKKVKKPKN